jgi:hypothetical protein
MPEELPRALDMALGSSKISDSQPEHDPIMEARVGEKYVAGGVHGIEEPCIEGVELVRCAREPPRPRSKADDAEWHRCDALEIGICIDPAGEELSQTDVFRQRGTYTFYSQIP